jgi:hypothetical protein
VKEWQFNVLFVVAVGGVLFLLVAPAIPGLEAIPKNPTAIGGIGTILTYVLTQKKSIVKSEELKDKKQEGGDTPNGSDH